VLRLLWIICALAALAACSSSSGSSANRSAAAVPAVYDACNRFTAAIEEPLQSARAQWMTAAEASAVGAHAPDLAALMKKVSPTGNALPDAESVNAYCHARGWPFGTRAAPLCDKWSAYVTANGGVARTEQFIRTTHFQGPDAHQYAADVLAISAECTARGWPHTTPTS
jgi:hypothetical protein